MPSIVQFGSLNLTHTTFLYGENTFAMAA